MKTAIGRAIAGAATRAARSLGAIQASLIVAKPAAASATAPDQGDAPVRNAAHIRIEVTLRGC
jgi:hypothetical protein